jgi:hypothetical protein
VSGRRTTTSSDESPQKRPPATTPEGRENQLILLATDLAEKQLREGTASAQVISHYLKLASTREKLEQTRLAGEIQLNKAKIDQIQSTTNSEALLLKAIAAMTSYRGTVDLQGEDDYRDD